MRVFDKIILVLVLLGSMVIYTDVKAESFELQLPIACGNSDNFATNLTERFNESMMFQSKSKNDRDEVLIHSFWFNMSSQTWTFIVTNENRKTTCILASGDKLEFVAPKGTQT